MNINPVSIVNINQNNTRKNLKANPNFTSIIPVKILIDGDPSVGFRNIKKVTRALSDILFKEIGDNLKAIELKQEFSRYDRDFKDPDGLGDKSELIRNRVLSGVSYLFTGPQAEQLDTLGRKIGPAKRKGLDNYGTTKTFEAKAFGRDYANQITKFINSNSKAKIRATINHETGAYQGEEMFLEIKTTSQGTFGKKNFKLFIDGIKFKPLKDIALRVVEEPKKPIEVKPSNPAPNKATTNSKSNDGIITDWPQGVRKSQSEGPQLDFNFEKRE